MVQASTNERLKHTVSKTHNNFEFSFQPIYYFSRSFGLMPFTVVYDSNGEAQRSKVRILDGFMFSVAICLCLTMAYYTCQGTNFLNLPYIFVLVGQNIQTMNMISGALVIGMDMCNRFKIIDILNRFTTFDKQVTEMIMKFIFSVMGPIFCLNLGGKLRS